MLAKLANSLADADTHTVQRREREINRYINEIFNKFLFFSISFFGTSVAQARTNAALRIRCQRLFRLAFVRRTLRVVCVVVCEIHFLLCSVVVVVVVFELR